MDPPVGAGSQGGVLHAGGGRDRSQPVVGDNVLSLATERPQVPWETNALRDPVRRLISLNQIFPGAHLPKSCPAPVVRGSSSARQGGGLR
jgi:hypothetical protein